MPIEIKELHIRLTVNVPAQDAPAAGKAGRPAASPAAETDQQAIVAECVEQVMQIIQEKSER